MADPDFPENATSAQRTAVRHFLDSVRRQQASSFTIDPRELFRRAGPLAGIQFDRVTANERDVIISGKDKDQRPVSVNLALYDFSTWSSASVGGPQDRDRATSSRALSGPQYTYNGVTGQTPIGETGRIADQLAALAHVSSALLKPQIGTRMLPPLATPPHATLQQKLALETFMTELNYSSGERAPFFDKITAPASDPGLVGLGGTLPDGTKMSVALDADGVETTIRGKDGRETRVRRDAAGGTIRRDLQGTGAVAKPRWGEDFSMSTTDSFLHAVRSHKGPLMPLRPNDELALKLADAAWQARKDLPGAPGPTPTTPSKVDDMIPPGYPSPFEDPRYRDILPPPSKGETPTKVTPDLPEAPARKAPAPAVP